ncbi:MAG: polysaccharide deacetylase family protein [Candidatus Jettenia caeni]|nr:polysaccharide deacetylase family protein [Candidatus Jettenia caeni]
MGKLKKRIINKLLKETSPFFDSYSLYFNMPSSKKKLKRLSDFAEVGIGVNIEGKITTLTPRYLEIGKNTTIQSIHIAPEKFVLIEKDVMTGNISCRKHSIITPQKSYEGEEIDEKCITISVDFEAGVALSHASKERWGHYRKFWDSRKAVEKLSQLFRKYEIPVTWAICGHLFLRECNGNHNIIEDDWGGHWFMHDPATNYKNNSEWYMPETIKTLAKEPLFEIGYHSFGHFLYQQCSEDTVKKDILMAKKIRSEWGLKLDSFVFPYNQCGYFDLLVEEGGFRNFRGKIGVICPSYGAINFKEFCYIHTTQVFSPSTMDRCNLQIQQLTRQNFNYYTHCYQWIENDGWKELEQWLKKLSRLMSLNKIKIKKFGELYG